MNIPENFFNIILNEFKEVQKFCNVAKTIDDKLYYFSASFGTLNRVMNFHYEPILTFMHQILQDVHQSFLNRFANSRNPAAITSQFPEDFFIKLFDYFDLLISAFQNKNENQIREILEKFSNLTYATSGNGFFLYLKGNLKLS